MIKQVRANYDAPTIEKEIQESWESDNAYLKTKALRENGERFYQRHSQRVIQIRSLVITLRQDVSEIS